MMNSSHLITFVQVARTGNFTSAAQSLGVSSSAVSKSVLRLEQDLGVKLFHRTTRRLSLTSEGQRLLERSLAVLEQLRELHEELTQGHKKLQGTLRLNFPATLGRNVMVKPVTRFAARHPDLRLELAFDDRVIDLAEEGVDVATRTGRLVDSATLIVTKFFDYQSVLCASPGFLAAHCPPQSVAELQALPCIRFQVRGEARPFPWRLKSGTFKASPRLVVEDLTAICRAAVEGAGVALLPTWSCLEELRSGALLEIMPQERPEPTTVWLAYHDRRYIAPKIRMFIEEMKTYSEQLSSCYLRDLTPA